MPCIIIAIMNWVVVEQVFFGGTFLVNVVKNNLFGRNEVWIQP